MKIPDYDPYNPHPRSPNADQEARDRFLLFNSPKTAGPGYENFGPVIELRVFAGNIMLDYYSKCDESFDPVVPYLAMNYFDRVISMQYPMAVPAVFGAVDSRKDQVQFLALCCLTLSWKMRSTTFTIKKLQVN
ncbi:uncharacterized protein LOC133780061 [Humulus lupulus]|uniref:uncharacterized protein LOC133780061 n=1 Tax=Humulus lupulus TaxID=3486 RepID=UPI002B40429B|nr:uncharacterized protein LOC133780061 [Humulus lupulus]